MTDDCPTTSYDTTAEAGSWLSIPETARVLGITTRTVHRRIEAGQLSKRDLERGRVEVWVPSHLASYDLSESTPDASQDTSVPPLDTTLALITQVNTLASQHLGTIERMAAENGALRERIGRLEFELEMAQARHATSDDDVRKPWWRVLWPW